MQTSLRQRFLAPLKPWPDRPVRLALVITDLDVGGAEKALVSLAMGLDSSRWQIKVFCLSAPGALADTLIESGLACECLGVSRRRPIQAIWRLASSLRQFQPELIQSFLFHANVACRFAAPFARRPWLLGGTRVAEREKRWHLVLDWLTQRLASGSVCVSEDVALFSRQVAHLDPNRLTVIPNGIDPAPYDQAHPLDRTALGITGPGPIVLFVGRLDIQKGLEELLDAASIVLADRSDWYLAIAGEGPLRNLIQQRIASNRDLGAHVHLLGRRDDIPQLLKTADYLVLPSRWEGMPNAILEAMAASRPVVATNVEGSRELVLPGVTGWLVPARDPLALAQALLQACENPERLRLLGQAARRRVEDTYSQAAAIRAYERVWANVLGYKIPDEHAALTS